MRKSYHRIFYAVSVPIVLALAFAAVYQLVLRPVDPEIAGKIGRATSSTEKKDEEGPNISVRRPEIMHFVKGRVTWRLYADSVESDSVAGRTRLAGSSGIFYRDEDDLESVFEFESPLTVYNEKSKMVVAEGKITGKLMPEMYELEAGVMRWSENDGRLTAENVVLRSGASTLKGGKLELRPKEKRLFLSGGVGAEIDIRSRRSPAGK